MTVAMETREQSIFSPLICKWGGGADHLSLRSFPVLKCGDFFGKNFLHQVWLNILKDECSLKFVFKFCSWVFLKWTLAERRPVTASGGTTSQGCGWQWVLHDCFLSVFQVLSSIGLVFFFLFFFFSLRHFFFSSHLFIFTQISFFASLLPRLPRRAGCPTSLSSAFVCSPADPGSLS